MFVDQLLLVDVFSQLYYLTYARKLTLHFSLSIFTDFHYHLIATDFYRLNTQDLRSSNQLNSNLVPRVFSLSNKAAASGRKNVLRILLRIPYRRLKAGFSVC